MARDRSGNPFLEWVKYGPTGREYTAVGCVVATRDVITCRMVQGVGANLVWRVRIYGQESGPSISTSSYAAPNITLMVLPASGGNTDGTTIVTLHGTNFATYSSPSVIFDGVLIPNTVKSQDAVTFLAPEVTNLTRSSFPVIVSVGGQFSTPVLFTYSDPYIHSVNVYESDTTGLLSLTIIGSSFTLKPLVKITRDGRIVIPSCALREHGEISCDLTVKRGSVTVSTPQATSNSKTFQFGEPLLLHSSLLSGDTSTVGYSSSNPAVLYVLGTEYG